MMNAALRTAVAALALAALVGPMASAVQAQGKLYRCGSTYSQTPCDLQAAPTKIVGVGGGEARDVALGIKTCAQAIAARHPAGPKLSVVGGKRGEARAVQFAGEAMVARDIEVTVAHVPVGSDRPVTESLQCLVSEDERRVLRTGDR